MRSLLFLLIVLIIPLTSFSQSFEVAPVEILYRLDPGEKEERFLKVTNHSSVRQQFSLTKADFTIDTDGRQTSMEANSSDYSCADWITLGENFFTLEPNETKNISAEMEVPPGNYATRWVSIYVQTTKERTAFGADTENLSTGINISGRIGVKVYRYPQNPEKPSLEISNLRESEESAPDDRTFTVEVKNVGSSIGRCKLSYVALNLRTAEKHSFKGPVFNLLPETERIIRFDLPDSLPPGEYALSAILDFGDKNVLEGTRMKSKLVISDD